MDVPFGNELDGRLFTPGAVNERDIVIRRIISICVPRFALLPLLILGRQLDGMAVAPAKLKIQDLLTRQGRWAFILWSAQQHQSRALWNDQCGEWAGIPVAEILSARNANAATQVLVSGFDRTPQIRQPQYLARVGFSAGTTIGIESVSGHQTEFRTTLKRSWRTDTVVVPAGTAAPASNGGSDFAARRFRCGYFADAGICFAYSPEWRSTLAKDFLPARIDHAAMPSGRKVANKDTVQYRVVGLLWEERNRCARSASASIRKRTSCQ